ncbi:MAG: sterol desaturase family protein [Methylococcaceae bacterium]|nr:sterol desaturase family protein [Methylococcaceae bacterium]
MESMIRFGFFLSVLVLMLGWEKIRPFRRFRQQRSERFFINLGMMTLNFVVVRLLAGGGALVAAKYAARHDLGLFHQLDLPSGFEIAAGLLVLDFAIYVQHRLLHAVPLFWRFHKVHHCDPGFDSTTAVRFHAVEILFSMYYKMVLVLALGVSPATVVVFEIILNACSLFNHGNVRMPDPWEKSIRKLLITPDMHRIHHSAIPEETNSNYGFSVPWWDWMCKSYRKDPASGHASMRIGIVDRNVPDRPGLLDLLTLPFSSAKDFSASGPSTADKERVE